MNYLRELLKIEADRLNWFLSHLSALNINLKTNNMFDLLKIELLLVSGNSDEEYVSAIREIRQGYLLLIKTAKRCAKTLNDELEARHLKTQETISIINLRDIAKRLVNIQDTANVDVISPWKDQKYIHGLLVSASAVDEVAKPGYESLYDSRLKACLNELLDMLSDLSHQYQNTDKWSRHELDSYLLQIDLNIIGDLIEYVEDMDAVRYQLFCKQYDVIKELPHVDLVRHNLLALSRELVDFFRETHLVQLRKIYAAISILMEASAEYKALESSRLLGPSFEFMDSKGNVDEDFKETRLQKIKGLMSKFKKHVIAAEQYYSYKPNLFPDSEIFKIVDFSRNNCLDYVKVYENLQECRVEDLRKILKYSSASRAFKSDIENACYLSEELSPWKRVPVPEVPVASNAASLFSQPFNPVDGLLATSSHAPNSSR